jgi:hypothetical protein
MSEPEKPKEGYKKKTGIGWKKIMIQITIKG